MYILRNRKRKANKSSARNVINKREMTMKNRIKNTVRTRRLRSSTSSDMSTSAVVSPTTNDENNDIDDDSVSNKKVDNDRVEVYKLRSNRTEKIESQQKGLSDSSKESAHEEEEEDEEHENSIVAETPKLDEAIREYLWKPTKLSTLTTTITEVTDQSGVTVLIRELNDIPTTNINTRPSRFLGYGNGGRGGKH